MRGRDGYAGGVLFSSRGVCFLAALLLGVGAQASALAGPPSQLIRGYLLPAPPVPLTSGCELSANLTVANEHTRSVDATGEAQVDAEMWTLGLGVRGVPEGGPEFGVRVGGQLVTGGLLDRPLNAYHDAVGLPGLVHPAGNTSSFVDTSAGQVAYGQGTAGFDDLILSVGERRGPWWVSAQLGVPTGSREHFISAGAFRAGWAVGFETPRWGVRGWVVTSLNVRETTLGFLDVRPAWGAGGWGRPEPLLPVNVEWLVETAPVSLPGDFGSWRASVTLVWTPAPGQGVAFSEDAHWPGPDVALEWRASRGCGR